MKLRAALLGGLYITSQAARVSAGGIHEVALRTSQLLARRGDDLESRLLRDASEMILYNDKHKRQEASPSPAEPGPSLTPASGDASQIDFAAWQRQTSEACGRSINALNGVANNPSGVAVCYNVPFLDNSTGVFQVELRLYNVSAPVDPWTGITIADTSLAFSYVGATVQEVEAETANFNKRDTTLSWPPIRHHIAVTRLTRRQDGGSVAGAAELDVIYYVGRLNSNLMGSAMSVGSLQQFLIPMISLGATSPITQQAVSADLSSSGASFVNGVFAQQQNASPTTDASPESASSIVASAVPFKIPGVTFGVQPIGFIITLVWTGLFVLTVGWGTWMRYQFREQFRRRIRREQAEKVNNI